MIGTEIVPQNQIQITITTTKNDNTNNNDNNHSNNEGSTKTDSNSLDETTLSLNPKNKDVLVPSDLFVKTTAVVNK
jgi:hypothetical protein